MSTRTWPLVISLPLLAAGCSLDFDQFGEPVGPAPTPDMIVGGDMAVDAADVGMVVDMVAPDLGPIDSDADGVADDVDNCPMLANPDQADLDGDLLGDACDDDTDGDGILNADDNCILAPNPDQLDLDGDMLGDVCDDDDDNDGLNDVDEAARGTDPRRADTDLDGLADGVDTCPVVADRVGLDTDGDLKGDACDADDDGDMVPDWRDNCPWTPNGDQGDVCAADLDGDGVPNEADTCPTVPNADQAITPCVARFEPLTYVRDSYGLGAADGSVLAGTYGGVVQITDGEVRTWTNADGLVGNRVSRLSVDADGRVWIATPQGLSAIRPDGIVSNLPLGEGLVGELRDVAVDGRGTLWVATDMGLLAQTPDGWNVTGMGPLPSADVRGLYADGQGRVWVATAGGVVRVVDGMLQPALAGLPALGAFLDAGSDGDSVWLMAEQGAVLVDDAGAPVASYMGFSARGVAPSDGGVWIATDDGVRRVDADGRLFPAASALLPDPRVRAAYGADDGPRWLATARGLVEVDGLFAHWGADQGLPTCINDGLRVGDALWFGSDDGLSRVLADGTVQPIEAGLPGPQVKVIRQLADGNVYVGTDNGVGVFGADGTPQLTLTAADGLPPGTITDIATGNGAEIWVGTDNAGAARRDGAGQWQVYTQATVGGRFLSDQIRTLAWDGGQMYIGSSQGITVFDQAAQAFEQPITNVGGLLRSPNVRDLVAGGGSLYAATELGVSVRDNAGTWRNWYRDVGGLPLGTGSDSVLAVEFDGTYVWARTTRSAQQPAGTLVRRRADAELGDQAAMTLFTPDAGLPDATGNQGVQLHYANGELFVAQCGDAAAPGGLTVLDGTRAVVRDLTDLGLPGGADVPVSLTRGLEGEPMFTALAGPSATLLSLGPDGTRTPVPVPLAVDALPLRCDVATGGTRMWCVLQGAGVGRRNDANDWRIIYQEIPALFEGEGRDIAVETDDRVYVATSRGVVLLDGNSLRTLNRAGSGGGLPDDDVRALYQAADSRVYMATAGGIGIFTHAGMEWQTLGAEQLPTVDVLSVTVAPDNTIWAGTPTGLMKISPDGMTVDTYGVGDGLPSGRVQALALGADGSLFVGTDAGLAVTGTAGGPFTAYGFADGLPGQAVHDIVVGAAGEVWVRSDDGIARFVAP